MSSFLSKMADIKILSGQSTSRTVKATEEYFDAVAIVLYGPAALDAATFIIEVTGDPSVAAPVWRTLQIGDPSNDAAPPGANKARVYFELAATAAFRITDSSGNVAADRVWEAQRQYVQTV